MNKCKTVMPRVLWLVNDGSRYDYTRHMLKELGITEVFCPEMYSYATIDQIATATTENNSLTLPAEELAILDSIDWTVESKDNQPLWKLINKYFDICFLSSNTPDGVEIVSQFFNGIVIWLSYGFDDTHSYSRLAGESNIDINKNLFRRFGGRVFYGEAFCRKLDDDFLNLRRIHLPLSFCSNFSHAKWRGSEKRIFFICPNIGIDSYYKDMYEKFTQDFNDIPYCIGGVQPLEVDEPYVIKDMTTDVFEQNICEMRVFFYPYNTLGYIHYEVFEAIRVGMPLIFIAGGLIDQIGGKNLPGRCQTVKEARKKIKCILNDDWTLIEGIQQSQRCLLESMKIENCIMAWRSSFQRVLDELNKTKNPTLPLTQNQVQRIAVILPTAYRGGTFRGAKLLAQAILLGSQKAGELVEVVFAHLDDEQYSPELFSDLPKSIKRRRYRWKTITNDDAHRAMAYAGRAMKVTSDKYQVPDDGINQFTDCDLWLVISDRLDQPLLPIRPYILMVYDYLQRYVPILTHEVEQVFMNVAHAAEHIFVTTKFTQQDAIQYAGLESNKVSKLPMLAPEFSLKKLGEEKVKKNLYFVWSTNLAPHKNHENAIKALEMYYGEYDGQLECFITGVNTEKLLTNALPHLGAFQSFYNASQKLKHYMNFVGELPELEYQALLSGAEFLWHAALIDNGTFSVVEAAYFGVPSLSSDYPPMREMNEQYGLNLQWMNALEPDDMARQLKYMEREHAQLRDNSPSAELLSEHSIDNLADIYWNKIQEYL